ncbi:NC domain-containing protein-like protein [Perilla frutescens var. hirtella]|uniref:NC domain-containing protein-like protein n=1 Tax=Perilla frutescens var. hirtella TaxID=608512 RepID=A0AAD4J7E1_PERFH|nr:NC domain-containing protein-like protein [Perilla frutescens var. hirtella]
MNDCSKSLDELSRINNQIDGFGIYIGGEKVVHFTQAQNLNAENSSFTSFSSSVPNATAACLNFPDCGCREHRSGVIMSCLNCFLGNGSLSRFEYGVSRVAFAAKIRSGTCTTAKSDPPEDVINRTMHLLENGFGNYELYTKNCEDFALYCKTGLICGRKDSGGSGQVASIIGVPVSAILTLPLRIFVSNPVVLGAATAVNYTLSRYATDVGVRSDVVKVEVEDLAASHGNLLSAEEDAWKLNTVTEVEDFATSHANLLSAEEDAWQLNSVTEVEDVTASHGNLLSAEEDACKLNAVTEVEDFATWHGHLLSAEEDVWQLNSVREVVDLATSHGSLLSAEEDAWQLNSLREVVDLATSHGSLLSADEDEWKLNGVTEVEDLAASHVNLLSAKEDAWQLNIVREVEDLAVSRGNLLSGEEDAWQLNSVREVEDIAASHGNSLSAEEDARKLNSVTEVEVSVVAFVAKIRSGTCTTAKSDLAEDVIHRAMHLLQNGFGNDELELYTKNCEDFALYCKTGLNCCQKDSGGGGQAALHGNSKA